MPMSVAAATPDGRGRVLAAVEGAADAVTVEDICQATGLHANTVRGHLDVLIAAGSVARESAEAVGRGRPRWLYRPGRAAAAPILFLAEALTAQLSRAGDADLAEEAAARWAAAIPDLPVAADPDQAVDGTVDALNRLGFTATASPVGDAIAVTACPYTYLVVDNPVICDIHAALVGRLLEQTGQPVSMTALDVGVRDGVCVARLQRPDLEPVRTITINGRPSADTAEGNLT